MCRIRAFRNKSLLENLRPSCHGYLSQLDWHTYFLNSMSSLAFRNGGKAFFPCKTRWHGNRCFPPWLSTLCWNIDFGLLRGEGEKQYEPSHRRIEVVSHWWWWCNPPLLKSEWGVSAPSFDCNCPSIWIRRSYEFRYLSQTKLGEL